MSKGRGLEAGRKKVLSRVYSQRPSWRGSPLLPPACGPSPRASPCIPRGSPPLFSPLLRAVQCSPRRRKNGGLLRRHGMQYLGTRCAVRSVSQFMRFVGRLCVARTNQQGDEDYPGSTLFCLLCCVQFAACCTVGDCLAVHISSLCSLQTTYVRCGYVCLTVCTSVSLLFL